MPELHARPRVYTAQYHRYTEKKTILSLSNVGRNE